MSSETAIVRGIKKFCSTHGEDTGKARRVNYLELVHSIGGRYAPSKIADGVRRLEEDGKGVYVGGISKIFGEKFQDLGEEPQSGCLYLFKRRRRAA